MKCQATIIWGDQHSAVVNGMWWIYDHGLGVLLPDDLISKQFLVIIIGTVASGVSKGLRIKWVRQGHRLSGAAPRIY